MAGAFQPNAFQNNAFQTSGIVNTLSLSLPVNCVLMGEALYNKTGRTLEGPPHPRITFKPRMSVVNK